MGRLSVVWYGQVLVRETNTIRYLANGVHNAIDGAVGNRYVFRYNYTFNSLVGDHGTEGGLARGARAHEVYRNIFNFSIPGVCGTRSGTSLFHDNSFIGVRSGVPTTCCTLTNFRESYARPDPVWSIADGTSPWDANDTEGNGTFIEGHPPFVFQSGSATVTTPEGRLTDSTKNWTPNQWVGYSVHDLGQATAYGSYITSNTRNTITYQNTTGPKRLIFNIRDRYQIHRVLIMMDQNGRGKTAKIAGNPPHLVSTGQPGWPDSALEPCYSWNNVHTPTGTVMGFSSRGGQPTTKLGIDYFNLGAGYPPNFTPLVVSNYYTAARNGVQYTGPYVYPHPLTSGNP